MKKSIRKKFLAIITICMFAGMIGLSLSTSTQGTDFSMSGIELMAYGSINGCLYECGDCPTGTICDPAGGGCCLEVCDGTCTDCFSSECTGSGQKCGSISNGTECKRSDV